MNMIAEKKFYLTEKKINDLRKEYEILKSLRAIKTNEEVPRLLEADDLDLDISLSEDMASLDARLVELENIFKNVEIIKPSQQKNIVDLGATVEVEVNKGKNKFTILGALEADPIAGIISNESPIGRALLGRKVGDKIVVTSPTKAVYKIKKIEYNEI